MISTLFACFLLTSATHQATFNTDVGWLYSGGESRLVRFVSQTDSPDAPGIFIPAPQTTGYIFLADDTFVISVAKPFGSAQIEYKRGTLTETGLGDFVSREAKPMKYANALSSALGEVTCESLGKFSIQLLGASKGLSTSQTIHRADGHGTTFEAVLGKGYGALQKFTELAVQHSGRVASERTICTFKVLIGRK